MAVRRKVGEWKRKAAFIVVMVELDNKIRLLKQGLLSEDETEDLEIFYYGRIEI